MDVQQVSVLFNRCETGPVWRLRVAWEPARDAMRGARFAMVGLERPSARLLPRPFSVSDAGRDADGVGYAEFLYKPLGRMTRALTKVSAGDRVEVLGPLGNGFPDPDPGRHVVMLAGGIGNAPFAFQLRDLLARGLATPDRITLFLAGRSAEDLWIQDEVRASGITIVEVSEDGSRGVKGRITEALAERLPALGPIEAFACGPTPMLEAIRLQALEHDFPAHLSVEEHMACGYGVCNACVIERQVEGCAAGEGPFAKVCVEGPVFAANEVYPHGSH